MKKYVQPLGFYVYYYIRSKDSITVPNAQKGSPYYVGKGKNRRAWSSPHSVNIPKDFDNVVIICDGLTEAQALQIEIVHIKMWGRVINQTGILRNLTDGGEGLSGYKHLAHTIEKRVATRKARNWRHSPETVEWLRQNSSGRTHTDETKRRISEKGKGKVRSLETRKRMSMAKKGIPKSESARLKSSLIQKGRKQPPELIEKRRLAQLAKGMSERGKAAVRANVLKASQTVRTCPHCMTTGKGGGMKRWHFDACAKNPLKCDVGDS